MLPEQIVAEGKALTVTVGVGLTVTTNVCGALAQPVVVPTTVYVVVVPGLTFTLAPVVALMLVLGLQA